MCQVSFGVRDFSKKWIGSEIFHKTFRGVTKVSHNTASKQPYNAIINIFNFLFQDGSYIFHKNLGGADFEKKIYGGSIFLVVKKTINVVRSILFFIEKN